jgi:EDD domain protein, DegV family
MSVKIITDSSSDLPADILKKFNIEMIPLKVSFENGETYLDRLELSPASFVEKMRSFKTLPKTSAPDPGIMMNVFTKGLSEAENVLFVSLSSELSCTCQNASLARYLLNSDKIHIFDSRSATLGTGILAVKAAQMSEQGLNISEILQELEMARTESKLNFTLDTLDNIVKGGRLKKHKGVLGNLLNIKPVMKINEYGTVEIIEMARGRRKAIRILEDMIREYAGESVQDKLIGISHVNCRSHAEDLALVIKKKYNPKEEIIISEMGSTIGTYAGEGGLAISF